MRRITASLRVFRDDLEPDAITELLQLAPSHAHRKGDLISPRCGTAKRNEGAWILDSDAPEDQALSAHIQSLVRLLGERSVLVAELSDSGYDISIYCGMFFPEEGVGTGQHNDSLSPQLMNFIASIHAELNISYYP